MKYMGSKRKIAKELVPVIQSYIDLSPNKIYIEPFVGGANVTEHIRCEQKWAYDINPYLIALYRYLQNGGKLPEDISREQFNAVRDNVSGFEEWYVGAVGFLAGFKGRFLTEGYSGTVTTNEGVRNYYRESRDGLLRQMEDLKGVQFNCANYLSIPMDTVSGCVIYCDPPYESTRQYSGVEDFDHKIFWETMRKWSKNNVVLVSELIAPLDFPYIWQIDMKRTIATESRSIVTERLFIHESHFDDNNNLDLL
jgi:site-specific DNA-adenine methylase